MKKGASIFMTAAGVIILLGGLLTYGLGIHERIPVPRPDLIVTGTSLIGILLAISYPAPATCCAASPGQWKSRKKTRETSH